MYKVHCKIIDEYFNDLHYIIMNKELERWAEQCTRRFNSLSAKYNKIYYAQSPLTNLSDTIELMVVGINPAAGENGGTGITNLNAAEFLNGNPSWNIRFSTDGKIDKDWSKFLGNAHSLLGYCNNMRCDTIDDDTKNVWTNLSPFASHKGSNDLPQELMTAGIKALLELIFILRPRKIVLLGTNAFNVLDRCKTNLPAEMEIEHLPIIDNIRLEIGRICTIPTVQICHPTGQWPISNRFTSIFLYLHSQFEITQGGVPICPLQQVRGKMQREIKSWVSRIAVVEDRLIGR